MASINLAKVTVAPDDPSGNKISIYVMNDGKLRTKDSSGNVLVIASTERQQDFTFEGSIIDSTKVLTLHAFSQYSIKELSVRSTAGTCELAIEIDGMPITGLDLVSVSPTKQVVSASANNVVSIGDQVTAVVTSAISLDDLFLSIKVV